MTRERKAEGEGEQSSMGVDNSIEIPDPDVAIAIDAAGLGPRERRLSVVEMLTLDRVLLELGSTTYYRATMRRSIRAWATSLYPQHEPRVQECIAARYVLAFERLIDADAPVSIALQALGLAPRHDERRRRSPAPTEKRSR